MVERYVREVQRAEWSRRELVSSGKCANPIEHRTNSGRNGQSDLERFDPEPVGVAPEEQNTNGKGDG
jgi:hypothetical protein